MLYAHKLTTTGHALEKFSSSQGLGAGGGLSPPYPH